MAALPSEQGSMSTFWRRCLHYLLAIGFVSIATLLTRKTQPVVQEISPLYFAAVVLTTWFGGLGPALVATLLAGWASGYFFYDIPAGSGAFGWDDALRLSVFLMVAILMSSLMHLKQLAEESLIRANDQLENRVRERTAELESSMRRVLESEEKFRILMEGVADYAICMLDVEGRVISWNAGSERIHGHRQPEILGNHFSDFYTANDQERRKPAEDLSRATVDNRYEDEGWRRRRDGSEFRANVIITSLRDEKGTLRGFAHITRDITELKRLEREVLEISEDEQQRIGQDLHDGLGQELTGLAFLSQNLRRKLAAHDLPEAAEEAERISRLVNRAIEQTRELARGLSPVELGADGLIAALRSLGDQEQRICGIPLELKLDPAVRVEDHNAAVHLYRISQEAITNAARHSGASQICLKLEDVDHDVIMTIEDDGKGIPIFAATARDSGKKGLGLRLMLYRARMIGATLTIRGAGQSGELSGQGIKQGIKEGIKLGIKQGRGTIIRCVYRNSSNGKVNGHGAPDSNDRGPVEQQAIAPLENSARG